MGVSRAVVFDCDGTLLDSMGAWHSLERDLAWMAGVELTPWQIDLLNANTLSQTVAYFHETYGIGRSFATLLEEARGMLLESYCTSVAPRAGACELVCDLKERGVRLAVASSSSRVFLRAGLERAGLFDLFDVVASAEDEGASKRDPRFAQSVAVRLGVAPQMSWCVDDSAYALEAMARAGFRTAGVYDSDAAGTFAQLARVADVAVRELSELDAGLLAGCACEGEQARPAMPQRLRAS